MKISSCRTPLRGIFLYFPVLLSSSRVFRSTEVEKKLLIARLIEFTSLQGEDIARFYRVRRRFESLRIFRRPYVERDEGWF